MKKPLFTGVCTALVTPFLDGKVNYPMVEMLLRRQLDAGIGACVICGTTGEAPTLTDDEKLELYRRSKEYVGDAMKIIAGTGTNSTEHTLYLSREAEKRGADGLLVVTPYYNRPTPTGLLDHYIAVSKAVRLPIILYNVPVRTGCDIPVSVYKTLSAIDNIAGVKEASSDISKITRIHAACGRDLPIWTGNDPHITPAISLGAVGVISVLSNILPAETKILTDAALDGDLDTATALQSTLSPLIDALFSESNPIPVKEALKILGYDCGDCRLPLTAMTDVNRQKLKKLLG